MVSVSPDVDREGWRNASPDINDADPAIGWLSFPTARSGYAGIFENYVFRTRDGGQHWEPIRRRALEIG